MIRKLTNKKEIKAEREYGEYMYIVMSELKSLDVRNFLSPESFEKCTKPIVCNIIKLVFLYKCLNSHKKLKYSERVKKWIFTVA